jgi:hypothetical protein
MPAIPKKLTVAVSLCAENDNAAAIAEKVQNRKIKAKPQ